MFHSNFSPLFFLIFLLSFAADALPLRLPAEKFKLSYIQNGTIENGVLNGIPQDSGAALVYHFSQDPEIFRHWNAFSLKCDQLTASNLALSVRGQKNLYFKTPKHNSNGSFTFILDKRTTNVKELRIYFNLGGRFSGKKTTLYFSDINFNNQLSVSPEDDITVLPMPHRQKIFPRTMLLPRLQAKYDLMKNYLGGYSMGTGTFTDRPLFFDRSLADSPLPVYNKLNSYKSFNRQLSCALEFAHGFALFGSSRPERFRIPVQYAERAGYHNVILLECPAPALKNFRHFSSQIDYALESSAVIKVNRRLVVSSYHGETLSPEQWRKTLQPYRKKYGRKVMFTCELRALAYRINKEYNQNGGRFTKKRIEEFKHYIRSYLEAVDGINFSGSNHLTAYKRGYPEYVFNAHAYERIIVPLFASAVSSKEYNGEKLLGLSAHKVYCQVRHTHSNVDEEGTRSLRESLRIALAANPDYILMPEWNETNEYTHIEPVVSDARATPRVVLAVLKKEFPDNEKIYPNIILSFRQENDLAAPIPIEILGLPDSSSPHSHVTLRLYGKDGTLLKSYPSRIFHHQSIEEQTILEPASQFSSHRYLIPELEIRWKEETKILREGLPHIRLTTAPNQLHRYVKIPLRDLPTLKQFSCKFTSDTHNVYVKGHVDCNEKIKTLELLADDIPLAAIDPRQEYSPLPGYELLCWRREVPANSQGYDDDELIITALQGKIKIRTPHQYSLSAMTHPCQENNIIRVPVGSGCNIREFYFYASPQAVLSIEHRNEKTILTVASVLSEKRYRHCCSHGVSWKVLVLQELPELPFPLNTHKLSYKLNAPLSDRSAPVYILRLITQSGQVYRSLPFMPEKHSANVSLPIWNLMKDSPEDLAVPVHLAKNIIYDFSPRLGDLLPSKDNRRIYDGILGGFDYRSHGAPGWSSLYAPEWQRENQDHVLRFKYGCGLLLCQPSFSRSAFEVELEAKFDNVKEQTILDVLGSLLPVRILQGKLQGYIRTHKGKFCWKGGTTLRPDCYYKIKISYDLRHFKIWLNGKQEVSIPASGTMIDGWIMGIGGVPINLPRNPNSVLLLPRQIDGTPNPGFHFQGTLKNLRIANYISAK